MTHNNSQPDVGSDTHANLVNEVAASVKILGVDFLAFSAKRQLDAPWPMLVHYRHSTSAEACGGEQPTIRVVADFVMQAKPKEGDSGEVFCEIACTLALTYTSPKAMGFTAEHLQAFADANGIYNAWPYWREFVQSATARMGLPPLMVPSYRLVSTDEEQSDEGEKETSK